MVFQNKKAFAYVPDNLEPEEAAQRTDVLCICAHADDCETMAFHAIGACFDSKERGFANVVVTDGAGSPRTGIYGGYTDEDMRRIRIGEQKQAAQIGRYALQVFLQYASAEVKDGGNRTAAGDIARVIAACAPRVVYTHNLADKHDTHVAVALRTIAAIKSLPIEKRPQKLYGMEVWRSLDWLSDKDKAVFDASMHENISDALMGVYDSQICGGKRYDLAIRGRRAANATYLGDHSVDTLRAAEYGVDMSALMRYGSVEPADFILQQIDKFRADVQDRLKRLG